LKEEEEEEEKKNLCVSFSKPKQPDD